MMQLRYIGLVLGLLFGAATAWADSEKALVIIKDFKFQPEVIQVKAGTTIRWENREKRQYHSVWFEALGEPEPVDYFFPEESYERRFDKAGTFPYRCGPHPEMRGVVEVVP